MTVICRRPADPAGDGRAGARGSGGNGTLASASRVPQLAQKLEPEALLRPHWRHTTPIAAPQRLQNRLSSAIWAPQLGQSIGATVKGLRRQNTSADDNSSSGAS
ncbi:MAG: hypothetical protein WBF58_21900 [Xanthobacteraceae bacterium]